MRAVGFTVNQSDPFEDKSVTAFAPRETSPYVNRLRMMWEKMQDPILQTFPIPPDISKNVASYLKKIDAIYVTDAYNSLSIEGYRVSADLREGVRLGNWNPDSIKADRDPRNALAARGYWRALQAVKRSIEKVLRGQNAGSVADKDHVGWYRDLWAERDRGDSKACRFGGISERTGIHPAVNARASEPRVSEGIDADVL